MAKLAGGKVLVMGLCNQKSYPVKYAVPTDRGLYVNASRRNVEEFADRWGIERERIFVLQNRRRRAR